MRLTQEPIIALIFGLLQQEGGGQGGAHRDTETDTLEVH